VDDDTGSDVATTQAYISGSGVVDGQLQIIGTNADDDIHINRFGSGNNAGYRVHASLLATNSSFIDIPAAGISSLLVMLLDGDNAAQLAGNVSLSAVLDGNGNDHLNGGSGQTVLLGGDGDDFLQGSNANDILIGGAWPIHSMAAPARTSLLAAALLRRRCQVAPGPARRVDFVTQSDRTASKSPRRKWTYSCRY
jgi:Ca2+-binding RTX toxin-like protein